MDIGHKVLSSYSSNIVYFVLFKEHITLNKDRLKKFRITILIERRARGDIIELFKIFRGLCSYGSSLFKFLIDFIGHKVKYIE